VAGLSTGKDATLTGAYNDAVHLLNSCERVSFVSNGTTVSGSIGAMSFPTFGIESNAYDLTLSAKASRSGQTSSCSWRARWTPRLCT